MKHERKRADMNGFDPHALPEFVPDAALWSRIVAAQQQRAARRGVRGFAFGGAAAAAICAAVLIGPRWMPIDPAGTSVAVNIQDESRSLESEWLRVAGAQAAAIGTARLRAIDTELQAAYDRSAGNDELAPLWQQRNRALRELIAGMQDGAVRRSASITQI
jgi:hypothetical protein